MSERREDHDLAAWFAQLREDTAARTPSFHATAHAVRSRARRPAPIRLHRLAAAAIAVVLAAGAINAVGRVLERRAFVASLLSSAEWTAPTDFLLGLPGSELLRTIPALGSVEDLVPSATLDKGR